MGHAEAAADRDIVADQFVAFEQGDQPEVVRQDIDRVVARRRERDLEFPRQVGRAVERLGLGAGVFGGQLAEKDLVVGPALRQQLRRQHPGIGIEAGVHPIAHRCGGCHHVAHDVAAGGQRRQQGVVDRRDVGLEILLDHAVELNALPCGQPERAVAVAVGEFVERQILRGGQASGRHPHAHHEGIILLLPALLQRGRGVAVELLVGAVEFQEVVAVLADLGPARRQFHGQRAAQAMAGLLQPLNARPLPRLRHGGEVLQITIASVYVAVIACVHREIGKIQQMALAPGAGAGIGERLSGGSVWLVGAGPGDPELLTVRAARALGEADVVLHDALPGPDVLRLARRGAVLVDVGKRKGQRSWLQEAINARLVAEARAGRRVVRLKGGDPFVFGRGGEEALALAAAGVPFRVVPGVTAGTAAPAAAGIPVTHRGLASSVTFVTGHAETGELPQAVDWEAMIHLGGTIVAFMALSRLDEIAVRVLAAGADPAIPVAIISRATLPGQLVLRSTLGTCTLDARRAAMPTPAVVVIGAVAGLPDLAAAGLAPLAAAGIPPTAPAPLVEGVA